MISTVEKVLFLKSIDLFSQVPGEDLAQIAHITDELHYEEGDDIFREGEPGDSLFLVIEGKVRVHRGGHALAELGQRQVFGEMALLDSEPRSASVSAVSDLTLLKIARDDFNEILAEKGEIAQGIIKVLTRRLRNTLSLQDVPEPAQAGAAESKVAALK
jgi:CRP/FNR family transcriptional regulator, cyclic AMP receptor protein